MDGAIPGLALAVVTPWYTNSLVLAAVAVVWLVLAYRWYGRHIERRLIGPTDAKTPAEAQYDGVDYCPARPVVLFGHHFASIAGAGPIIGPILAVAAFGWTPTVLWILIGVVFIGGVHDYLALMISARNRGNSLPDVARDALGASARVLFLIFVWIGLVLVITAFCSVTTDTFLEAPEIVLPTFLLMAIAVLFGYLTYRVGLKTWQSTSIALTLLAGAIALGFVFPIDLTKTFGVPAQYVRMVWLLVLLGYGLIASVAPVWILLQPRDYLSTWILIGGMLAGFVGIAWVQPTLKAPSVTSFSTSQGMLWPIMFITVACGAVSGFHCLVAGGTTSKQLSSERQGRFVGFGAMLTEGALAIMAVVAVGAGLHFTQAEAGGGGYALTELVKPGGAGPITAFGYGFGVLTDPFLGRLGRACGVVGLGMIIGTMMVNAFVMTTLDTTVRLARFITHELAGSRVRIFRNRFVASLAPVALAYWLAVQKSAFSSLWKVFGAANQLIAALALIVITGYLMKRGKPTLYTAIPAVFMLVTTMAALVALAYQHLVKAQTPNYTLGLTAVVLLGLAVVMAVPGRRALFGLRPAPSPLPEPEAETSL